MRSKERAAPPLAPPVSRAGNRDTPLPGVEALSALARQSRVTLVFGARDEAHNEAVVLREVLLDC